MKGLEIARDFFFNWGLPILEAEFPGLAGRAAAGRFSGSDVLGADDLISRDHNWGPQFTLILSQDDYDRFAAPLSEKTNSNSRLVWKGYHVDGAGDKNVIIDEVSHWIREHIGFAAFPQSDTDWDIIVKDRSLGGTSEERESALYYLKYGALWLDNNATFTQWRDVLAKYPEKVLLARLAEACFSVWQYGEYNFVDRVVKRGDTMTISVCLGHFTEAVMRLMLLLHRDFTPYWKWLSHEFRRLDCAAHYVPLLEAVLQSVDRDEQARLVDRICKDVHQELLSMGIVTGQGESQYPLLNAHFELMAVSA